MNTLLRYLVITLFVVLLGAWFISMYKSCANTPDTDLTEIIDDEDSLDEALSEELDAGDLRDGDADYNSEMDALDAEIAALEAELGELDTDDAPASKPKANKPTTRSKPATAVSNPIPRTNRSPTGAEFMVITGSYSARSNADAMEDKLADLGHNDAEIVQFDLSEYFSVCAGRFNNIENAKRLSEKLKAAGVQAYVHKRRQ